MPPSCCYGRVDAIGSDDYPTNHIAIPATFYTRLHIHKLQLSTDKSRVSSELPVSTSLVISSWTPAFVPPTTESPSSNILPCSTNYGAYLAISVTTASRRIRPTTALLQKAAEFEFTFAMEDAVVCSPIAELTALAIPVYRD